jgi:methionyl-tRNA formyltransferase
MTADDYSVVVEELAALKPDFIVVASFGVILKSDLLNLPKHGCVNLHASLLPKYRGMSPIQAAILAGEEKTGCTTMMMDQGVDTGDTLLAESIDIRPDETAGQLERRLAELGAPLVVKTLLGILDGTVKPIEQDDSLATRTRRITKGSGRIDWTQDAGSISRKIRAMLPWPTAYTVWSGRRLIILEARALPDTRSESGTVVSVSPLVIGTGNGGLEVHAVKVEGRREMAAKAFVAGYHLKIGDRIG